jgi:hypothetical protein
LKRVKAGIAATWAEAVPAEPGAPGFTVTAGSAGHGPFSVCGTRARLPAFMVSQASAGQVSGKMA